MTRRLVLGETIRMRLTPAIISPWLRGMKGYLGNLMANSFLAARHVGKVHGHVLAILDISKFLFTFIMSPSSISFSVF